MEYLSKTRGSDIGFAGRHATNSPTAEGRLHVSVRELDGECCQVIHISYRISIYEMKTHLATKAFRLESPSNPHGTFSC